MFSVQIDTARGWRGGQNQGTLTTMGLRHPRHAVAAASLALSLGPPDPPPALVAARRVDFHLKGNSFSRWKYRQVDRFICASEAIRQMLIADGVEASRTVTIHEGIDVERVARTPAVDVRAE